MRIGLIGVAGRLGSVLAAGIAAADDLELVAGVSPSHAGRSARRGGPCPRRRPRGGGHRRGLARCARRREGRRRLEVTGPGDGRRAPRWLLEHGIHAVVGATGYSRPTSRPHASSPRPDRPEALIVPNFSIGAVLVERFAAEAARHLPNVEIVELHHDRKVDAPSGTALATAAAIASRSAMTSRRRRRRRARGRRGSAGSAPPRDPGACRPAARPRRARGGAPRWRGAAAHAAARHDGPQRRSSPGALLACRRVGGLDGLVVGLGELLCSR
jgi:4-hydroxy-tetrahydrodipicolinate reductase